MTKKTSAVFFFLFLISAVVPLGGCFQAAPQAKFDVVIKEGLVYDGTSSKPRITNIGIQGDKIAAIGSFTGETAKTINARGLIVTPGFIDVHSHTDLILKEKGIWRIVAYIKNSINGNHNYLYQGVTTIITGNSGKGFADTAKWLGWVDSLKFGANVYHLAPAGTIHQEMFDAEQMPLNEKQKELFKKRLIKEMDNGAIGISFDLSKNPDRMFTRKELIDIASDVQPYGGIISINLRDSSGATDATGNPALVSSLKEAVEIGRFSQAAIEISSLELTAPWNNLNYTQINKVIHDARKEGINITIDQAPYDADINTLTSFLPAEYVVGNAIKSQYLSAEGKDQILKAIDKLLTTLGPEKFLILSYPANKSYEGKTIRQIAVSESKKPSLSYWEMTVANQPPLVAVADASDRFAKRIMPSQLVFTASESITYVQGKALPHPSYWGAFPRKLRKYALEDKIIRLNEAIRSMTLLPAEKFKLRGRGQIVIGNYADIAIIDLKKVKDKATFLQPEQYAEGVQYLLVNGIVCLEKGKVNGKKGGRPQKRI
jgi:N-acyl-D-amino-acid deacylase